MKLLPDDNYELKNVKMLNRNYLYFSYLNQQLKRCSILVQSLRIYNFVADCEIYVIAQSYFAILSDPPCFGNRYAINGAEINK